MPPHGPCPSDTTVTVYERELRPGGHSHTVTVDYDGEPIAVDTGFIVYNEFNYPDFTQLLAHLRVETVASNMSFALSADNGRFEWKGGGGNLAACSAGCSRSRRTCCRRRTCGCCATSCASTR